MKSPVFKIGFGKGATDGAPVIPDPQATGSYTLGSTNQLTGLRICFAKDASHAGYLPLPSNPGEPLPVIPITGYGDMFRAIYDVDVNGVVDRVDFVKVDEVENLQDIINDIYFQISQGGGGGSGSAANVIVATNNGVDNILSGHPVAIRGSEYRIGKSYSPFHSVIGVAINDSAPGSQLWVQTDGVVTFPTGTWDLVTGAVGGLGIDATYFASLSGNMTSTPPENSPEYLVKIGRSISTTKLLLDLNLTIKL